MTNFVDQVVQEFGALKAIEKVAFTAGLLGLLSLPVLSWVITLFRMRSTRRHVLALEELNSVLRIERDSAEKQAAVDKARAELWMPDAWMQIAIRERERGNEEKAIDALRGGFEQIREGLARTSLALAGHHLSLTVGSDAVENLVEGERQARIATLLDPRDPDAVFLLEEAELMRGDVEHTIVDVHIAYRPTNEDEAETAVEAILAQATRHWFEGRLHVAHRLTRRAVLIVEGAGLTRQPLGLRAECEHARYAFHCGKRGEALERVQTLISLHGETKGLRNPDVLIARLLEAEILGMSSDSDKAIGRFARLSPDLADVFGSDDVVTLECRYYEVRTLAMRRELQQSLLKVRALVKDMHRALGARHYLFLAAMNQKARIYLEMGEAVQALNIVKVVIAEERRIYNPEHPNVLATLFVEATCLEQLKQFQESFEKIRELLPIHERVLGTSHPDVLASYHLEAAVLFGLGRHDEALNKVRGLLPTREMLLGNDHPQVQLSRRLEARITAAM
jgi:tetratricopeptide (TPR) repeat protein